MNFSQALEQLKFGKKVARTGWNGKGMFIYAVGIVGERTVPSHLLRDEAWHHVGKAVGDFKPVKINPHIDMKAADGSIVVGWLASQTDIFAEDWVVVVD